MSFAEPDKIYVDTNVYVDFVTNRSNEYGRPLGPDAEKVFLKVQRGHYRLIVSTWVLEEMRQYVKPEETTMLFEMLKDSIIKVSFTEEEKEEAKRMNPHWGDALHAIIAHREGAKFLITRNMEHFRPYSHLVQPVHPKEF